MPSFSPASRIVSCALIWAVLGATPSAASPSSAQAATVPAANPAGFGGFVQALWPEARGRGVSRATFEAAFRGVTPDPKIIALTRRQSEFVRPVWDYIADGVSAQRLARGQAMASEWRQTLAAVERTYGVPRDVVLGVWGMETNFGAVMGSTDTVRALATLAYTRYRGDFFKAELLAALEILQDEPGGRSRLRGSWAGAMGHTQFMPSSYRAFAVDGNRDGVRDIWGSVPDALASTANYLRRHGWQPGLPWGFEVRLPQGFDYRNLRQGFSSWAGLGVRRTDGATMPRSGEATLFLPAGAGGPAFLVTDNYAVIKAYNASDAYAMAVARPRRPDRGRAPDPGRVARARAVPRPGPAPGGAGAPPAPRFLSRRARRQARFRHPRGRAPVPAPSQPRARRLRRLGPPASIADDPVTAACAEPISPLAPHALYWPGRNRAGPLPCVGSIACR